MFLNLMLFFSFYKVNSLLKVGGPVIVFFLYDNKNKFRYHILVNIKWEGPISSCFYDKIVLATRFYSE